MTSEGAGLSVSVVVCAYTERRWRETGLAVRSCLEQDEAPKEVIICVDHNPSLEARLRDAFPECVVISNASTRGLSGARNTAIEAASGEIVAFLDDDAVARPDWLRSLTGAFRDPAVAAVGGQAIPIWPGGARPAWFPMEYGWVVGCSYVGQPTKREAVRNLMGCNMAFRSDAFRDVGGFSVGLGRVGSLPVGCEETELCIRLGRRRAGEAIVFEPSAKVDHHVSAERATVGYFMRRCWSEGISKAAVGRLVGAGDALSSERAHVTHVLLQGALREARRGVRSGDGAALARSALIVAGLSLAASGYVYGRLRAG